MKRYQVILLVILLALAVTTVATADEGAITADITFGRARFVAMGMKPKTNGAITLRGTLGQTLVGSAANTNLYLCNGIWCGWPFLFQIQMPVVLRD